MNIVVHNHRDLEFDLADLEVLIKDYIEEGGAIVSGNSMNVLLSFIIFLYSSTKLRCASFHKYGYSNEDIVISIKCIKDLSMIWNIELPITCRMYRPNVCSSVSRANSSRSDRGV